MRTPAKANLDKALGACLKKHRLRGGHSQRDIALVLGVSFQQVQKLESGANRISAAHLSMLVTLLHISSDDLMALVPGPKGHSYSAERNADHFSETPEGKKLMLDFLAIADRDLQQQVLVLLQAMQSRKTP